MMGILEREESKRERLGGFPQEDNELAQGEISTRQGATCREDTVNEPRYLS